MFTLANSNRPLANTRDFAHTQASGLIDQNMSAGGFTRALQVNAQAAYERASTIVSEGQWPLSVNELGKVHKQMCRGLQTGGGAMNEGELLRYQASCGRLFNDVGSSNSSRDRITALAEHTARCEGMKIFTDHNSTVHRLALEAHMDMFLGKAKRPSIDQDDYLAAVAKAQLGDSTSLAKLIEKNQEAGMRLQDQTQRLGPDYSTSLSLER